MEQNKENKLRFTPAEIKVREAGTTQGRHIIEGCAIVFNRETTLWDGQYTRLREVIAPTCVDEEFLSAQDVKLNIMHDRTQTIARKTQNNEGKLQLQLREDGLYFSADLPDTEQVRQVVEGIRDKIFTGCSFEFVEGAFSDEVTILPDGREDTLRTQTKFKTLYALTIAMDPAYPQTSVGERERIEAHETDIKERQSSHSRGNCDDDVATTRQREQAIRQRKHQQMQMKLQSI